MYHCENCYREISSYEYYCNGHLCECCRRDRIKI